MNENNQPNGQIQITKDGPYLVSGGLPLSEQWIETNAEGESMDYREGKKFPAQPQYALCRCGHSSNKPFCDGTHKKVNFDGTETASNEPYLEQAERIDGPTMSLTDAEALCAFARFCDPKGRIWNLVKLTDTEEATDPDNERRDPPLSVDQNVVNCADLVVRAVVNILFVVVCHRELLRR